MLRFDVVTLFPDMFAVVRDLGVTGRAHGQGLWNLRAWNPRDFTHDVHRTVDDRPYGGGPGMVMMAAPLAAAVQAAQRDRAAASVSTAASTSASSAVLVSGQASSRTGDPAGGQAPVPDALQAPVILLSPTGRRFDQQRAHALAAGPGAIFICGRYEGVDQRFIDRYVTEEISLGDFVLSGGELAAMAIIDAAVRLLPGVLNDDESAVQDSFNPALSGLLDSPHYTRPEVYEDEAVPSPLLSGHHANIARWRREQSLRLTAARRPDLIDQARKQGLLTKDDERFLDSLANRG